jgi:hypothetical protein
VATPWRKQSGERRKQSTIGGPQRGPAFLPAEHDELMSQHEQLDVFSELAAPASDQQPKHSREGEIGERKEHEADASIARYRAQDEQERRSWTSVNELRSPARSGIHARAPTSKPALMPAQPTGAAHRTGILKPLSSLDLDDALVARIPLEQAASPRIAAGERRGRFGGDGSWGPFHALHPFA